MSNNMLLRCEKHPSKPYRYTANPVGYPKTATICGREKCENPGKALLNEAEWRQYRAGQTVFVFNSNVVKIQLEPHG